jgi:hypothetical protein
MPTQAQDSSSGGALRWHLAITYCIEQSINLLAYAKTQGFHSNQPLCLIRSSLVENYPRLMSAQESLHESYEKPVANHTDCNQLHYSLLAAKPLLEHQQILSLPYLR